MDSRRGRRTAEGRCRCRPELPTAGRHPTPRCQGKPAPDEPAVPAATIPLEAPLVGQRLRQGDALAPRGTPHTGQDSHNAARGLRRDRELHLPGNGVCPDRRRTDGTHRQLPTGIELAHGTHGTARPATTPRTAPLGQHRHLPDQQRHRRAATAQAQRLHQPLPAVHGGTRAACRDGRIGHVVHQVRGSRLPAAPQSVCRTAEQGQPRGAGQLPLRRRLCQPPPEACPLLRDDDKRAG